MYGSIDKSKALAFLVHCADISHPAKEWSLHSRWTDLLVEEFFKQVSLPIWITSCSMFSSKYTRNERFLSGDTAQSSELRKQAVIIVMFNVITKASSVLQFHIDTFTDIKFLVYL